MARGHYFRLLILLLVSIFNPRLSEVCANEERLQSKRERVHRDNSAVTPLMLCGVPQLSRGLRLRGGRVTCFFLCCFCPNWHKKSVVGLQSPGADPGIWHRLWIRVATSFIWSCGKAPLAGRANSSLGKRWLPGVRKCHCGFQGSPYLVCCVVCSHNPDEGRRLSFKSD